MRLAVPILLAIGCGSPSALVTDAPVGSGTTDATDAASASASRCTESGTALTCTSHTSEVAGRAVTYELPLGMPPAGGWPTVVFFQGSFVPGSHAFTAMPSDPFGQLELTRTVQALLDRGYAVVAPDARSGGSSFWQTNVPPCATAWSGCEDDVLVQRLLAAIGAGDLGPLAVDRLHAMGISSGGFMTSRMAVSYPGKFRSLAIHSGSYATCGVACTVPALPADHPPTLFLHGDADTTVPLSVMTPYRDQLAASGVATDTVIHVGAGHEWVTEGKTAIPAWFDAHP